MAKKHWLYNSFHMTAKIQEVSVQIYQDRLYETYRKTKTSLNSAPYKLNLSIGEGMIQSGKLSRGLT